MPPDPETFPVEAVDRLRQSLRMTMRDLWVRYFAVGGNGSVGEVEQWLAGASEPPTRDKALLAQAIDDEACDQGADHPAWSLGL